MINNAAEAKSVVTLAKFPPIGVRGQGSPFACLAHGLATPSDYVAQANNSILTMVQIETVAGVDNVDEICQVEGIGRLVWLEKMDRIDIYQLDLIFIGPNDLALSLLGYTPAKYTEKIFLDAIDKVVASAKKHGKKVGTLSVDGEAAKKAKERFDLVLLSADARAIQTWYRRELGIARS